MTDSRAAAIQRALSTTAGGFLRNPGGPSTCTRCYTPIHSHGLCPSCIRVDLMDDGPDNIGFITYAGHLDPIAQSGRVMRGYKATAFPDGGTYRQTVALMAAMGLLGHIQCPGRLAGSPVSAWATVPSLPPKEHGREHPLRAIVRSLARPTATEVILTPSDSATNPRGIDRHNFRSSTNAADRHVLIIDDTWTGGGHATSAALAVRDAGATHVSVLALARWLTLGWEATTAQWAKSQLTFPDFDPGVCPWTQLECPS